MTLPLHKLHEPRLDFLQIHFTNDAMIWVIAKYALVTAAALALFSAMRVLVMNAWLGFDMAVTITAALFVTAGVLFGMRVSRVPSKQHEHLPSETVVRLLPLQAVLSKREMEVYDLLLQNKTNQQICDVLFIEMSTLKTHINRIYKKLDVSSRRQLFAKHGAGVNQPVENINRLETGSQA